MRLSDINDSVHLSTHSQWNQWNQWRRPQRPQPPPLPRLPFASDGVPEMQAPFVQSKRREAVTSHFCLFVICCFVVFLWGGRGDTTCPGFHTELIQIDKKHQIKAVYRTLNMFISVLSVCTHRQIHAHTHMRSSNQNRGKVIYDLFGK